MSLKTETQLRQELAEVWSMLKAERAARAAAMSAPVATEADLDDDHPLWLVNAQIIGLLEGDGASEDHENVIAFLRATGLPESTVKRVHLAIVNAEKK